MYYYYYLTTTGARRKGLEALWEFVPRIRMQMDEYNSGVVEKKKNVYLQFLPVNRLSYHSYLNEF